MRLFRRARPPNVVWLCADDYTPAVCGAAGNAVARTLNLDRLAAAGLWCDRAFCACPLSTPSRQAFWTGRYPRAAGVTLSPTPLPDDEVTAPALFRRHGYRTAAFGKTHFYAPRRHEFDECADLRDFRAWLAGRERRPLPPGAEVLGPWRPFVDPAAVWLNAAGRPCAAHDDEMAGTFIATRAADYLLARPREPFFLYASFYETHSPFWFPVEYRGRFRPGDVPVPAVAAQDREHVPRVFQSLTEEDKFGIAASYYTTAEFLDKNVGVVLDALDRSGLAGRTVVLFTSDHGYLLGEHGRFEKHCCYEPAVRAALVWRYPGVVAPGRRTAALVELIDVLPTLLELCGVPAPANLHGRSLAPLLRGEADAHRDRIFVEYADNEEAMVRTDRWKLIYSTGRRFRRDGYAPERLPGRTVRLFDLANDPDELNDLAAERQHAGLVGGLLDELAGHLKRTERVPERIPTTGDVFAVLDALVPPVEESQRSED